MKPELDLNANFSQKGKSLQREREEQEEVPGDAANRKLFFDAKRFFLSTKKRPGRAPGLQHISVIPPTLQPWRNMMNDSLMKLDLFMFCNTICYPFH